MGNCQAAESATVVILHPGGTKVEKLYWSVTATEVMNSNPGFYVAMLLPSPAEKANGPSKRMKLLRPHDVLIIGQVYRLVSSQDVLKQFAAKKSVKLGKLLKEMGAFDTVEHMEAQFAATELGLDSNSENGVAPKMEHNQRIANPGSSRGARKHSGGARQWRPALHSIEEQQLGI